MNSTNNLNELGSGFFPSRASSWECSPTNTLIIAMWALTRGHSQAMPKLLPHTNYEITNVCCFKHSVCGNLLWKNRKLIQHVNRINSHFSSYLELYENPTNWNHISNRFKYFHASYRLNPPTHSCPFIQLLVQPWVKMETETNERVCHSVDELLRVWATAVASGKKKRWQMQERTQFYFIFWQKHYPVHP